MMKPRILHVGKFYLPSPGGIETHVRNLAVRQARFASVNVVVANRFAHNEVSEIEGVRVTRLARVGTIASMPICPALRGAIRHSPADMTRPDQIAAMIAEAESAFGSVDILVNNAGVQFVSPVEDFPIDKWDQIIAINMTSVFHACKAAVPHMRKKGWGRVVNIASAHGLAASPFKSAYVTAKHGVVGFTKVLGLETAKENITCNAICPGYVRTPLVEKQVDDQAKVHGIPRERVITDVILAPQPTGRFVEIDEVAGMAVFLCSDAAKSITGTTLSMDGGWTAR